MKQNDSVNRIIAIITIVAAVFTAFFGLLSLDDDDFLAWLIISAPILILCINYYIAAEFHSIAEKKGFSEMKYFWYCFWLGALGALMVVALPDRGSSKDN